jgi:hypothetical protein
MININNKSVFNPRYIFTLLCVSIITITSVSAQKSTVRIRLDYFNEDGQSYLTTKVTTLVGRRHEPVGGVIINLFLNEETQEGMMGNITTNEDGEGTFILPPKFYTAVDSLYEYEFIGRLTNDPNYRDQRKITTIQKVVLDMDFMIEDSERQIMAKVMYVTESGLEPAESVELRFFVQRLFGQLPIGGDYTITDESGEVTIMFPENIPGDEKGEIKILCNIIDHETMGNLSVSHKLNWGEIPVYSNFDEKRTMWSARDKAPWALIIFPNLALLIVWGLIINLFFILIKIRNLGV